MTQRTHVGFVGLGAIGLPMARSLVSAGFPVTGVDPAELGRERAAAAGINAVAGVEGLAEASVIVVMVADSRQLSQVVDAAVAADVVRGRTWVIMSTVGTDAVKHAGAALEAAGAAVVDAPVSGGIARATRGDLVLFVSGPDVALATVEPVLRAMGEPRIVGAAVGDGQSIKVVNQHLCAVHIVAAAEALALSERLGLDPAFVLETIGGGAAASFMLGDRGPRMLAGAEAPVLSQIGIFVKDTGLVADAAAAVDLDAPVLAAARERFLAAAERGLTARDDSSVIETYLRKDGER
ncbi:NAD(P)-dependent oxidoreductase [Microbacterium ureisolvens]|uniref:NAD(P)-dependent oxidoreductase n=1 Tax=Microbacterium ureisolvens TaxID=2781186 RepID=UPI003642D910